MGKLNAPREVPYAFKVFALDGWVWLYDDSERTYICDQVPKIFAEPLYALNESDDGSEYESMPEADYWGEAAVKSAELHADVMVEAADVPYEEAWNNAREDAQGNYRL